ncbi:ABC transporter ATP-binding protein [Mycolicibacterium palauense]|uniref:ABC transporter ATP-binding protein n=1 Tax=Mycolicibacterium palauense TaxID=2034511 RepID=UPI000BFEAFED|nr:ABC transporter ATP-binding protein [Mycolicibacterium palauense]
MTAGATDEGLHAQIGVQRGELALDVGFDVSPGRTLALLGPNGAGKSTVLRILAGLLRPQRGRVTLGPTVLDDADSGEHLPAHRRPVGMVFQDYLLFPHLSVLDNVAFGLRSRGVRRPQARAQAREWLQRVGIAEHARSRPGALSGGQAQRAALARALIGEPRLLLLDEPLSALDARTRLTIRSELHRHLAAFPGPAVVVSHDPIDAIALADDVAVIENGGVVQTGAAHDIARRPRTDYVARLMGLTLLEGFAVGTTVRLDSGGELTSTQSMSGPVYAAIRPEHVSLYTAPPHGSPRNVWPARLVAATPYSTTVRCDLDGPVPLTADVTAAAFAELALAPGDSVWASVKAHEIDIYGR